MKTLDRVILLVLALVLVIVGGLLGYTQQHANLNTQDSAAAMVISIVAMVAAYVCARKALSE